MPILLNYLTNIALKVERVNLLYKDIWDRLPLTHRGKVTNVQYTSVSLGWRTGSMFSHTRWFKRIFIRKFLTDTTITHIYIVN